MPEIFHIVPANLRSSALVPVGALVLAVFIVVGLLFVASIRGSRTSTFELSPDGLHLRGDVYGRRVPAAELRGGAAKVIDLHADGALRPVRRTMGTALPGYRAGWFRLADGEKALLYVTDPRRVVYVPTRAGYSLLLSVDQPAEFLKRLQAIAPGG
jgi:hypothetical protein